MDARNPFYTQKIKELKSVDFSNLSKEYYIGINYERVSYLDVMVALASNPALKEPLMKDNLLCSTSR